MASRPVRPALSATEPWSEAADDQQPAGRQRDGADASTSVVPAQGDDIVVPSTPPVLPRLFLAPALGDTAILQGGWWPHSFDPIAELPGLVLALCARYGSVRELRLPSVDWYRPFSRAAA